MDVATRELTREASSAAAAAAVATRARVKPAALRSTAAPPDQTWEQAPDSPDESDTTGNDLSPLMPALAGRNALVSGIGDRGGSADSSRTTHGLPVDVAAMQLCTQSSSASPAHDSPAIERASNAGNSTCTSKVLFTEQSVAVVPLGSAAALLACTGSELQVQVDSTHPGRALLGAGEHTGQRMFDGYTPLMIATQALKIDAIQVLIVAGADVHGTDREGNTALHAAARAGDARCVKLLLRAGARVNAQTIAGITPLLSALQAPPTNEETVRLLLEAGSKANVRTPNGVTATILAARHGTGRLVRAILSAGGSTSKPVQGGWTPLIVAAQEGNVAAVQELLEAGALLTERTAGGWTALHAAAFNARGKVVQLLLDHGRGVGIDARTIDGTTPLLAAAHSSRGQMVDTLLTPGLYAHCSWLGDGKPLDGAANDQQRAIVGALVKAGASVNAQARDGWTTLMSAAAVGDAVIVDVLLAAGAAPNARCRDGVTPLLLASGGGHTAAVASLLRAGACVNAHCSLSVTPLMAAASGNHLATLRALLTAGADVRFVRVAPGSTDPETALTFALRRGHDAAADMLLAAGARVGWHDARVALVMGVCRTNARLTSVVVHAFVARCVRTVRMGCLIAILTVVVAVVADSVLFAVSR